MKISKAITTAAATLVTAATAAVALGPPANAASSARLTIQPSGRSGYSYVSICGNTSLSFPGGAFVQIWLYGDDPVWDDFLGGPWEATAIDYGLYPCGGNLSTTFLVANSRLNEDWGTDEVYAKVRYVNRRNGSTATVNTNVISRNF